MQPAGSSGRGSRFSARVASLKPADTVDACTSPESALKALLRAGDRLPDHGVEDGACAQRLHGVRGRDLVRRRRHRGEGAGRQRNRRSAVSAAVISERCVWVCRRVAARVRRVRGRRRRSRGRRGSRGSRGRRWRCRDAEHDAIRILGEMRREEGEVRGHIREPRAGHSACRGEDGEHRSAGDAGPRQAPAPSRR